MLKRKWQQTQSMCLPKRILNMPTQESVDHVWRILLDPPVLSGLACWQEEDRYGLLYAIWVYSFWSSFVSYQAACLVKKFFWSILSVLYGRHFIISLLLCNKSYHFCHVLFVRYISVHLVYTQGGTTQGSSSRQGSLGTILEATYHRHVTYNNVI